MTPQSKRQLTPSMEALLLKVAQCFPRPLPQPDGGGNFMCFWAICSRSLVTADGRVTETGRKLVAAITAQRDSLDAVVARCLKDATP